MPKARRNVPLTEWGETKTKQLKAQVTATAEELIKGMAARFAPSLAEFFERLGRSLPYVLRALSAPPKTLSKSIALYLVNHSLSIESLADKCCLPVERLQEIIDGREATLEERSALSVGLGMEIEEVEAIYMSERKWRNGKEEVRNGNR